MLVFKIFRDSEWRALEADGVTAGAPVDIADGFVHLSTAVQVAETAAKHFADEDGLWLLTLETEGLGEALRWEPSRGGALFPHLYRPIKLAEIVTVHRLPLGPDGHVFPPGLLP